jgi:hypothetical protein
MAPSLRALLTLFTLATAAKKPPPKRVALVSFAAPWDYGPYAHQLRELAEHWLSTHHVVWIGLSGTVDRIQYGAPKISPLVGYRGAGMSKDPVKKVSKLNRIFEKVRDAAQKMNLNLIWWRRWRRHDHTRVYA